MSVNSSRAAYIAATSQIGGNDIVIEHVGSIVRGAVHCKGNRTFRFRWSLQRPFKSSQNPVPGHRLSTQANHHAASRDVCSN